jgi:hypothetical protein
MGFPVLTLQDRAVLRINTATKTGEDLCANTYCLSRGVCAERKESWKGGAEEPWNQEKKTSTVDRV